MNFHENLKQLRKRANLKRKDIAEILGMHPNAYGMYEAGTREPNIEKLCKIAAALHVTTDELLGYEIDKHGQMQKFLYSVGLILMTEAEDDAVFVEEAFSTPTRKWRYDSIDALQKAVQAVNNDFTANTKALLKSALKEKFYDDSKELTPCPHIKK